jgi:hypothetical protein
MRSLPKMRRSLARSSFGLTVAACALAAAAWTVATPPPAAPDSAPAHARSCPSLDGVKSFSGVVTPSYSDQAAASSPAYGGLITIAVDHGAALNVDLPASHSGPAFGVTILFGRVTSANSIHADQSVDRPLKGHISGTELAKNVGSAFLLVSPELCKYQIMVGYSTTTQFTGDEGAKPGTTVTVTAITPREDIPASLAFANSAEIPVYEGCSNQPNSVPRPTGCYTFGGGWKTDFETYKLCPSTVPDNSCKPSESSMGTAHISWSLHPTY